MKKMNWLTKRFGGVVACMALLVAQMAATQFCIIFYQDEVPESVRNLRKKTK